MPSATAVLEAPVFTATTPPFAYPSPADDERSHTVENDWTVTSVSLIKPPTAKEPESPSRYVGGLLVRAGESISHKRELEGGFRSPQFRRIVQPEVTQEAQQWLRGDLEIINRRVILICIEQARWMHVPLNKLQLSIRRSWEGEFSELLLQVFVHANLPQSLALWDAIGDSIQRWARRQPTRLRRILNEKYAVFVEPLYPL